MGVQASITLAASFWESCQGLWLRESQEGSQTLLHPLPHGCVTIQQISKGWLEASDIVDVPNCE